MNQVWKRAAAPITYQHAILALVLWGCLQVVGVFLELRGTVEAFAAFMRGDIRPSWLVSTTSTSTTSTTSTTRAEPTS